MTSNSKGLILDRRSLIAGASALGLASMWAAVFADVGVSVLAILNATRALRLPQTSLYSKRL